MKIINVSKSASWGWHLSLFGIGLPYPRIPTKTSRAWKRRFEGLSNDEVRLIISEQYEGFLGYKPNLDSPKTMSEKLCWLKINYHNPLITKCADKVCARDYFLEHLPGRKDLLVKQLAVCDRWEEVPFPDLPESFVLKSNWGSGAQVIVTDKRSFDSSKIKSKVCRWLDRKSNQYYNFFEWGYKNIVPKIVVEEFLSYKYKMEFFCFNGEPKFFWVVLDDKTTKTKANLYWLDGSKIDVTSHYPNFGGKLEKPNCFDGMIGAAKKLAEEFPFVRCDFYVLEDGFRFSELTFYHWAGYCDFNPASLDRKFGDLIKLPLSV